MNPSLICFDLIKSFEGLQLRAYKPIPTEKYYTIGYGHCAADIKKGQLITLQQAENLLQQDVNAIARKLTPYTSQLTQNQFDALVSLVFNIGFYNFRYSMTGQAVAQLGITTKPLDVARRITLWTRAGGKVLLGLQRRRVEEANLFLGRQRFALVDGNIHELY